MSPRSRFLALAVAATFAVLLMVRYADPSPDAVQSLDGPARRTDTLPAESDHSAALPDHDRVVTTSEKEAPLPAREPTGRPGRMGTVAGCVQTADGSRISGAAVWVVADDANWQGRTDVDGEYAAVLQNRTSRHQIVVVAHAPGFRPSEARVLFPAGEQRVECNMTLREGAGVTGRVVHGEVPAVGAVVTAVPKERQRPCWTNRLGRFFMGYQVDAPPTRLCVNHGELGFAEAYIPTEAAGTLVDLGEIQLSAMANPLSFRIVYPGGLGASDLPVRVASVESHILDSRRGAAVWETVTDSGGAVQLYGMQEGTYNVLFPGAMVHEMWESPMVVSGQGETVTLAGLRVRLRILVNGVPVPLGAVQVKWTRLDQDEGQTWNRIDVADDRVVPLGSRWRIEASLQDEGAASVDLVADTAGQCTVPIDL